MEECSVPGTAADVKQARKVEQHTAGRRAAVRRLDLLHQDDRFAVLVDVYVGSRRTLTAHQP